MTPVMATVLGQSRPSESYRRRLRGHLGRLLRNNVLRAVVGAHLVAAAIILVRAEGWLQPSELLAYDVLRVAWAGPLTADRVVLVGATEGDITAGDAKSGRRWGWPLRDGALAALLERIASYKPRAIGIDLYRDIPEPPGTEELDAVLRRHPEIVWAFKLRDDAGPGIAPPLSLRDSDRAVLADVVDDRPVLRRGLLFADDGSNQYTGMGLALALAYLAPEHVQLAAGEGDDLRLGKAVIKPLDQSRGPYVKLDNRGYQMLLDYRGGPQPFPLWSISEVMDRADLAERIRDRIVIVGVTAESVKDAFATPFSSGFAGAEPVNGVAIHGHLADQLIRAALDGAAMLDGLPRQFEDLWIWVWALGGAILGLVIRSTLPAIIGVAAGMVVIGAVGYVSFGQALLLPVVPGVLAWVGTAVVTNQLLHAASNRARARLRRSFEHYLPPAVIGQMVDADVLPTLGGERREISAIFTDVAGFTTFSEARDPEELAQIVNEYFDGLCAAVHRHGGLVNAFIGDGMLAFFGAPQQQPDHADRAIAAALDIETFGEKFHAEQNARGIEFGHTRVGVHTGFAFVGNVGAREKLQYTALGDMLNTASRLEGLNKAIGSRICVSSDIVAKCRRYQFRPISAFIVKGRRDPTEVFAPIDPERYGPEWIQRYRLAFSALEAHDPEAAAQFAALYRDDPQDPCVAFHYHRLAEGESGTLIEMQEK
jgi:adenylate cyclase